MAVSLRTMIADGKITGRVPGILTLAQEHGASTGHHGRHSPRWSTRA